MEQNPLYLLIQKEWAKPGGYKIVCYSCEHGKTLWSLPTTLAITSHLLFPISPLNQGFTVIMFFEVTFSNILQCHRVCIAKCKATKACNNLALYFKPLCSPTYSRHLKVANDYPNSDANIKYLTKIEFPVLSIAVWNPPHC